MDHTAKVIDSVGNQILKAMVLELQMQSPRYQSMAQDKQQEVINHAVHQIAAKSYDSLAVKIIKAQVKEEIQFQVTCVGTPPSAHWVDEIGKEAMLIFCDPAGFKLGLDSFKAPAKQRDLLDDDSAPN